MVAIYGLGEILGRQGELAATAEVEAVDAGAQVRAVGLGTGDGEHTDSCLSGPPTHARKMPDVPS